MSYLYKHIYDMSLVDSGAKNQTHGNICSKGKQEKYAFRSKKIASDDHHLEYVLFWSNC